MLNTSLLWCNLSDGNNRYMSSNNSIIINIVIIMIYVDTIFRYF